MIKLGDIGFLTDEMIRQALKLNSRTSSWNPKIERDEGELRLVMDDMTLTNRQGVWYSSKDDISTQIELGIINNVATIDL